MRGTNNGDVNGRVYNAMKVHAIRDATQCVHKGVCTQAGRRQIFDAGVKIWTRRYQILHNTQWRALRKRSSPFLT